MSVRASHDRCDIVSIQTVESSSQNGAKGVSIQYSSVEAAGRAFAAFGSTAIRLFPHSWGWDKGSILSNRSVFISGSPERILNVLKTVYSSSSVDIGRRGELWFKKAHGIPIPRNEING